jgi:hypothetical protein
MNNGKLCENQTENCTMIIKSVRIKKEKRERDGEPECLRDLVVYMGFPSVRR